MRRVASRRSERFIEMALVAVVAPSVAVFVSVHNAGASSPPSVSVSPQGNYHDGQTIAVTMGPNSFFTPHASIRILECADPGGLASNLPVDDSTCDGSTIQPNTILVETNGSFAQSAYTVYLLPSSTLGEQANFKPICNQTNYCVLYVGQDQNDFTAPKVFSSPFLVDAAAGSSGTTSTSGTSTSGTSNSSNGAAGSTSTAATPTTSSPTGSDAGVSVNTSASLANTGSPRELWWIAVSGMTILLSGVAGRRLVLRSGR